MPSQALRLVFQSEIKTPHNAATHIVSVGIHKECKFNQFMLTNVQKMKCFKSTALP